MQHWKRNFALVWFANFISAVGMMGILPLFPLYLRELGITDPTRQRIWAGLLVAAAPLTASLLSPFWGALGDRIGRKWMMVRANAGITVFVGLMGLAAGPWMLLVLRLCQGLFSGFIAPGMTLVSVLTPPEKQGRVAGLLHTAVLAGGVTGPLLGGWVMDHFDGRWVFFLCSGWSALALVVTALFVVEPPRSPAPKGEARIPWPALGRSVVREVAGLLSPGPLRQVLLTVFVIRFGVGLVDPVLALHVETLHSGEGLGAATGAVFGATWIATLFLTPFFGKWGDQMGHGRLLTVCASGSAVLYVVQSLVPTVPALVVVRFLTGAFFAGIFPAAYAIAARASSTDRRGGSFGLTFSSQGLANALGPIAGGLLASQIGLRPLFWLAAGLMVVGVWQVLRKKSHDDQSPDSKYPNARNRSSSSSENSGAVSSSEALSGS